MVKMSMRQIEDTTKRMEGENELMDERYRTMICNDCGLKPTTYFIVNRLGRYPDYDYTDSYNPQGIVEVYNLQSSSTVG